MDKASALMTQFIIAELRARDPALLPAEVAAPDALRTAQVPGALKRDILTHAAARGGPELILELGQGIKAHAAAPIIDVLTNSRTPEVLLAKWARLERYGHSKNRSRLSVLDAGTARGDAAVRIERYATSGPPPVAVENLMICGFLIALLELCGCRGVVCRMGTADEVVFADGAAAGLGAAALAGSRLWTVAWADFDAARFAPAPADLAAVLRFVAPAGAPPRPVRAAAALVCEDLGRPWKVAELAREIGTSARSLQRRFTDAGYSFSSLVRAARVAAAGRQLTATDLSATEIGYACGFADAAHFSRNFAAATGMSPTAYRDFSGAG